MKKSRKKTSMGVSPYWEQLSKNAVLKAEEIKLYETDLDRKQLSINPHIPAETYNEIADIVDWEVMANERVVDDAFLLTIGGGFESVLFAITNDSAKDIKEETWNELMDSNGRCMDRLNETAKERWLEEQLVDRKSLIKHAKTFTKKHWENISTFQPIDFKFAKWFAMKLSTKVVAEHNPLHKLTNDEIEELRQYVTKTLEKKIELGEKIDWENLTDRHLVTDEFLEKYRDKLPRKPRSIIVDAGWMHLTARAGAGKTGDFMKMRKALIEGITDETKIRFI